MVRQLTRTTREVHHHRDDQLGLDRVQEAGIGFDLVAVADSFGHHARVPEGKHTVRKDPVCRAFDRDDVGEAERARLRRRIVRRARLAEQSRR